MDPVAKIRHLLITDMTSKEKALRFFIAHLLWPRGNELRQLFGTADQAEPFDFVEETFKDWEDFKAGRRGYSDYDPDDFLFFCETNVPKGNIEDTVKSAISNQCHELRLLLSCLRELNYLERDSLELKDIRETKRAIKSMIDYFLKPQ